MVQFLLDRGHIIFALIGIVNTTTAFNSIGYLNFFAAIFYMTKTSFTDPGVIPRGNLEAPLETEPSKTGFGVDEESLCDNSNFLYRNILITIVKDSIEASENNRKGPSERILPASAVSSTTANIPLYKYTHYFIPE